MPIWLSLICIALELLLVLGLIALWFALGRVHAKLIQTRLKLAVLFQLVYERNHQGRSLFQQARRAVVGLIGLWLPWWAVPAYSGLTWANTQWQSIRTRVKRAG